MEAMLTTIADYLWTQSWQIAVLVVVVALASWALRNRSAHVRYLLWLLVLAKCLTPPVVEVPLAVLPDRVPPAVTPIISATPSQEEVVQTPIEEGLPPTPTSAACEPLRLTTRQWLAVGWLTGVAVFACIALTKAARTILWLRRERRVLPRTSGDSFDETFGSLRVKRPPGVWLIEGVGQPFVWGILRGDIYLPDHFAQIEDDEHRRDILAHEISHVLRFDAAVNILQIIAQGIFWFHPLLWWANQRIRREREKCCDEMAIAHLGSRPKDYGSAIVSTLIQAQESTRPVPSLAVAGPVKNIEERIRTMLRPGKKFCKRPSLIAATAVLTLALLTVPTTLVLSARAQSKAANLSLHEAAAKGDIDQVKSLLSKGADVNSKDYSRLDTMGMTPLHCAALYGHKDIVELLIVKGADINVKDQEGDTPVLLAIVGASSNCKEIVQLLMAKGAQVSAIHMAAYLGDMDKVRTLLNQGTDVDAKWVHDATPLLFAVVGGQHDVVKFLIDQGANVNVRIIGGGTLLHAAVGSGDSEMVKLLIDKGADVKAGEKSDVELLAPLEGSIMRTLDLLEPGKDKAEAMRLWWESKKDIVKLVRARGGRIPTQVVALGASMGLKDMVELAINEGEDVNARAQSRQEKTLLHEAVDSGHKELVQYLLDKGADINAKERQGWTPLHMASAAGEREIVELLLTKGAALNVGDIRGGTALWYAKERGNKEIVGLLRSHGAEEQAPAISLHEAARDGDLERVKSLVSKGADVNAMDNRLAGTPLHLAAYYAHPDVVQFLISKGANVNARNKWNRTALDEAVDQNRGNIAEVLRTHGAKSGSSVTAGRAEPARPLLENAASKFDIPKKNLEIPEPMQSCAENLRNIYAAMKNYEKDKGTLPNWLSDLVPDYVSKETLLCPHNPVQAGPLRQGRDPRLPCSYGYTFAPDRRGMKERSPGVTRRDWKIAQVELFGDVVPLVRCYIHGSLDDSVINLGVSGKIYLSPMSWELVFMPEYYKQNEIETMKVLEKSSR